jgi:hypothetical protein
MAEIFIEFENEFRGRDGHVYEARVCGRERADRLWEGWVEFVPLDTAAATLRTARETTQPNREDLDYWARGLTTGFLEGALDRAIGVSYPDLRRRAVGARPAFEGPGEPPRHGARPSTPPAHAVLDPFAVYAEGAGILRGQLDALNEGHLRNIVKAYGLSDSPALSIDTMSHVELRNLILAAVQRARE